MSDQVCIVTLEACPFCGGEASADGVKRYCDATVAEQDWRQSEFYYCNCMRCGASNCGLVGHRTRDDAIAAWNRRALAPSIPAEIGGLVERSESSDPDKFTAWDRLRVHAATDDYDFFDTEHAAEILEWVTEAASLIQSQAARIAELERAASAALRDQRK